MASGGKVISTQVLSVRGLRQNPVDLRSGTTHLTRYCRGPKSHEVSHLSPR